MKFYSKSYFEIIGRKGKYLTLLAKTNVSIIGAILSLVIMLVGIFIIPTRIYNITNIQEFNILGNMPFAEKCNYSLETDLDFEGKSSNVWSSITYYYGTFEGNNHTINNLHYEGNAKKTKQYGAYGNSTGIKYYSDGFVGVNYGTIKNIKFDNCIFKILYVDSQNVDNAYLGIIAGENGGVIQECSLNNCFVEYKLKDKKRDGASFYFNTLIGMNSAYSERKHYLYSDPSYEGKSINNIITYDINYVADDGYTLISNKGNE